MRMELVGKVWVKRSPRPRVRLWYARMCLVVLLAVGIVSWDRYTAPPEDVKDCAFHVRPVVARRSGSRVSERHLAG